MGQQMFVSSKHIKQTLQKQIFFFSFLLFLEIPFSYPVIEEIFLESYW